jgi:hypothetical protein
MGARARVIAGGLVACARSVANGDVLLVGVLAHGFSLPYRASPVVLDLSANPNKFIRFIFGGRRVRF